MKSIDHAGRTVQDKRIRRMSFLPSNNNNHNNSKKRQWVDRQNQHYERYYCEICNVWMASDKASVLTHKNGKKHTDALQAAQSKKNAASVQQEKLQQQLQKSIQLMEQSAMASIQQDATLFTGTNLYNTHSSYMMPYNNHMIQPSLSTLLPQPPPPPPPPPPPQQHSNKERKDWEDRKKHRDEEKSRKNNNDEEEDSNNPSTNRKKRPKLVIGENDGYYIIGNTTTTTTTTTSIQRNSSNNTNNYDVEKDTTTNVTWLMGTIFGTLLEEEMPIQVWFGNTLATDNEMQLIQNQHYWRDAIIVSIRQQSSPPSQTPSATEINHDTNQEQQQQQDQTVVDVAYIETANDDIEQIKKSIPLRHIRIQLGNPMDDRIPTTLEEARLVAMGGEEIKVTKQMQQQAIAEMDDNTGLSGWTTVHVHRTTARNKMKEERDRIRRERHDATIKAAKIAKEIEARQMEEAKVANADDSALGAYDVWGRTQDGYKGIQILPDVSATTSSNTNSTIHDLYGTKLATDGMKNTAFKKKSTVASKKRNNRRTTTTDDD